MHTTITRLVRASRTNDRRQWASARTLEDLANNTADWLEGRVRYQPGYFGLSAAPETKPLIEHLARYNRHGLMTCDSQPATGPGGIWAQRAWVQGFCTHDTADKISRAVDPTDLIAIWTAPGSSGSTRIPVTLKDREPYTWAGPMPDASINDYYAYDCPGAIHALHDAWQVAVIDSQWGRNTLLWDLLAEALEAEG